MARGAPGSRAGRSCIDGDRLRSHIRAERRTAQAGGHRFDGVPPQGARGVRACTAAALKRDDMSDVEQAEQIVRELRARRDGSISRAATILDNESQALDREI